jgi:hypothetical protein
MPEAAMPKMLPKSELELLRKTDSLPVCDTLQMVQIPSELNIDSGILSVYEERFAYGTPADAARVPNKKGPPLNRRAFPLPRHEKNQRLHFSGKTKP